MTTPPLIDHSSDAYFALYFNQGSINQQKQLAFGFASPEQLTQAEAQMDRLCRLVLCSDTSLWRQESRIYWGLHASDGLRPTRFWLRSFTSSTKLVSPYLRQWASLLERFGPLVISTNHPCIHEFINNNPLLASGETSSPSYHEQLEARFELLDWAEKHLPTDIRAKVEGIEQLPL